MSNGRESESDGNVSGTITRRAALRAVAAGGAATALVGTASANGSGDRPPARIVGVSSRSGERAARQQAASVKRVLDFGDIGRAVAGRFSDQAVSALRQRADVRYVEEDITMHALGRAGAQKKPPWAGGGGGGGGGNSGQCLPWGIDRVDAEVAHANDDTGSGVDVAIIDTGIDSDHPDLIDNLGDGKAFVKARGHYAEAWDDDNEHGTHCAGIAAAVDNGQGVVGVAPGATLHAVKVLDKSGSGSLSDVAAGIEYVADQGWDVGSMSLGASSGAQTLEDACTYATDWGVLLVAAAGNSGPCTDCVGYPAAYSEVVAVGSTTSNDTLSGFSSTGPEVEIAAPGSSIYSTVPGGYDTLSGTSMACPHVSGAGGLLMADGTSNTKARNTLSSSAEDVSLDPNESGAGLLDVEQAVLGTTDGDDWDKTHTNCP
ncbi:MAG: S8 family serine peptidase [Haloarculaceae archaeon]